MHKGGALLLSLLPKTGGKKAPKQLSLSLPQSQQLKRNLIEDGRDSFYCACVSLVDGIRGINCGFYSWATVKLYYSVFYALRAGLAAEGVCIFYYNHGSFWIEGIPGAAGTGADGGTHEAALRIFARRNPTHSLLSNPIGGIEPMDWIISRREDSNYRIARFTEPEVCPHFVQVGRLGMRRAIEAYLNDTRQQYMFDHEHAMLAYPLAVLREMGKSIATIGGANVSEDEFNFLRQESKDGHGRLNALVRFFQQII